jgi:hypothetical protein
MAKQRDRRKRKAESREAGWLARLPPDERLACTLRLAGLSIDQAANQLRLHGGRSRFEGWHENPPDEVDYQFVLKLGTLAHVDVRWLATGEPSSAGLAAARNFCRRSWSHLHTGECELIEQLLLVTPQPAEVPGVCCYCGCTDELSCGDCYWINAESTICSACLVTQED